MNVVSLKYLAKLQLAYFLRNKLGFEQAFMASAFQRKENPPRSLGLGRVKTLLSWVVARGAVRQYDWMASNAKDS